MTNLEPEISPSYDPTREPRHPAQPDDGSRDRAEPQEHMAGTVRPPTPGTAWQADPQAPWQADPQAPGRPDPGSPGEDQMVGVPGEDPREPSMPHGSSGQDAGSMD
jgi:hypothetical protein